MAHAYKTPPRARSASLALAATLALTGCPADSDDVRPPRDQFFFPTALAITPDASTLFVVNANADLLYNTGAVTVVELDAIDGLLADPAANDCDRDSERPSIWQCNEAQAVTGGGTRGVRIGNFASDVDVQDLGDGALRLFVTVRGDPSVTWIDYRDGELLCPGDEEVPRCDGDSRLIRLLDDPGQPTITGEPFEVYVDSAGEFAVVTHLVSAAVSLIDAPRDGQPVLTDTLSGLFAANGTLQSALGVAARRLTDDPDEESLLYVTSRTENRVYMLYVEDAGPVPRLVPNQYFFLDSVTPANNFEDTRGIAFSADGTRAYIVNRSPPMLHVLDTADSAGGQPRNQILTHVELCRDPANVVVADSGRGERVYVSCFPAGQVWVVDPERGQLDAVISTGRGANGMAVDPARDRLYVANYLEDTLAVVDIDPDAERANQVILKLGRPKQAGGD